MGENDVKPKPDNERPLITKKQRESALKKMQSDKSLRAVYRQYYVDEEGRQCFAAN